MPPKTKTDKKQPISTTQAKPKVVEVRSRKNNNIKKVIPQVQQTNNVEDIPPPPPATENLQQEIILEPTLQQVENINPPKSFPLFSEPFVWENDKNFINAWRNVPLSSDCHYTVGVGHEQDTQKNRFLLKQTNPCRSNDNNISNDDIFIDYFVPSVPDGREFIIDSMFSSNAGKNKEDPQNYQDSNNDDGNFRSIEDLLARIPNENPLSVLSSYSYSSNNSNNTFANIMKFIHRNENNDDEPELIKIELRRKVDLVQKLVSLCKQSMLSRDWIRTKYTEIFMLRFRRFVAMQLIKNGRRGILLIKDNFDGATPEDSFNEKISNENNNSNEQDENGKKDEQHILSEFGKAVRRYYSPEALSSQEHAVVFSVNPKMTPDLELFSEMKNNNNRNNNNNVMPSSANSAETISKAMYAVSPLFDIELESLVGIQTLAHFLEFNKEELEANILSHLSLSVPSPEQRHQNNNKISESTLSIIRDQIYLLLVNYIVHLQLQNVILSHKYRKTEQCMRRWKENILNSGDNNNNDLPFNSASVSSTSSKFPPNFSTKMKIQFRLVSSREILAPLMNRFNSEKEMMMNEKIEKLKKEYKNMKNKRKERRRLEKEEWNKLHPKKKNRNNIINNNNNNIRLISARLKVTLTNKSNNNKTVRVTNLANNNKKVQQQNPVNVDAAVAVDSKMNKNAPKSNNIKFHRNNNTKNVAVVAADSEPSSTKPNEPQTNTNNNKNANNNVIKNNKPFFDNDDFKIHVVKKFNSDDDDDEENENLRHNKNKKNPSTLLTHGETAMENIFLYMLSRIPPSGVRRAATANLDDDENED